MRRTPPEENLPLIHLPGWPTHTPAANEGASPTAPPAAAPQEKTYIVPPFSFTYGYGIGPFKVSLSLSLTGFSFQDVPWADHASKAFAAGAAVADMLGLAASGAGTVVSAVGGIFPPAVPVTEVLGALIAGADIGLGILGTTATNVSDVLAGNTGFVSDGQGIDGIAYGRDSIVSDRNFVLGTVANLVSVAPEPYTSTAAGVVGTYISASQVDHDAEGFMGKEGGKIVFTGDGTGTQALKEQLLDDWFILDKSPALESDPVAGVNAWVEGVKSGIPELETAVLQAS